jgi:glycine cleavage system H protein
MSDLRFTKEHEWIRVEGGEGTVGITDHAQEQLGDMVFVELPEIGKAVEKGADAAVVESVKAASEVYSPVTGEVVAVNEALRDEPAKVNEDPTGDGWIFRVRIDDTSELEAFMDEGAYQAYLKDVE